MVLPLLLAMSPMTGLAEKGNHITEKQSDLPTTGFEDRNGNSWTTLDEEPSFLKEVAEKSDRMTYSVIGHSVEDRPLYLIRVGYPNPPSDDDIAKGRNILIMGTPHGNEPAGREMTLKLLRNLAFTDDPELLDLLKKATILFVPSQNPDGRAADIRKNAWSVDNNRDHLNLRTPEIQAVDKIINKFHPDITVDAHERTSGPDPDIEMLWPRNLNVDDQLAALNKEMVQDYLRPEDEQAGISTGLYGSPGGSGSGNERILRNMMGLRHGLGLLTETSRKATKQNRVKAQMHTVQSLLNFYLERFDDIGKVVKEAPERKAEAGADQYPFYLDGTRGWDPAKYPPVKLDPAPCGYLLNTSQADAVSRHIKLFSLKTEKVGDNGVFVPMNQPMMTVIPLLLDKRAKYNEVDGLALTDCTDPASIEPPAVQEPLQYETAFIGDKANESPDNWSSLWKDGSWTVLDNPHRLQQVVTGSGGHQALGPNKVGNIRGDVEVSGVVRASGKSSDTLFQMALNMSGVSGSQNSYYVDIRSPGASSSANRVRIGRYVDGSYKLLKSAKLPFTVANDTWYQAVLQRKGDTLRAKVWPYGEKEPGEWLVKADDPVLEHGWVGMSHFTSGRVNDWAFYGVGTGGKTAPRAPENLFEKPNAANIKSAVEQFAKEDEFANDQVAHALKLHLTAVDHFEEQGAFNKVVKHMEGFKVLLKHQKDNELISSKAYYSLKINANALIQQWQ